MRAGVHEVPRSELFRGESGVGVFVTGSLSGRETQLNHTPELRVLTGSKTLQ